VSRLTALRLKDYACFSDRRRYPCDFHFLCSARSGHLEAVKLLVENGADVNMETYGSGGTALWWAKQIHGDDHPVIEFLESIGALEAGPEL